MLRLERHMNQQVMLPNTANSDLIILYYNLSSISIIGCVILIIIMMESEKVLPIGFADQIIDLEMKLEEDESFEVIQILSQLYRVLNIRCRLQSTIIWKMISRRLPISKRSSIFYRSSWSTIQEH
jgi:hypothetical protein